MVRQSLYSTYFASQAIAIGIKSSQTKGKIGKIGSVLKEISSHVPLAGAGVRLIGQVLVQVDVKKQERMLKNFANIAIGNDVDNLFKDVSKKIVLLKLNLETKETFFGKVKKFLKDQLEEQATAQLSSIDVSEFGISVPDLYDAFETTTKEATGTLKETILSKGEEKVKEKAEEIIVDKIVPDKDVKELYISGQKDAEIVSKFITAIIFAGEIKGYRIPEKVNQIVDLVERDFKSQEIASRFMDQIKPHTKQLLDPTPDQEDGSEHTKKSKKGKQDEKSKKDEVTVKDKLLQIVFKGLQVEWSKIKYISQEQILDKLVKGFTDCTEGSNSILEGCISSRNYHKGYKIGSEVFEKAFADVLKRVIEDCTERTFAREQSNFENSSVEVHSANIDCVNETRKAPTQANESEPRTRNREGPSEESDKILGPFELIPNPGEGDCGIYAVMHAMWGKKESDKDQAPIIRNQLAEVMSGFVDLYRYRERLDDSINAGHAEVVGLYERIFGGSEEGFARFKFIALETIRAPLSDEAISEESRNNREKEATKLESINNWEDLSRGENKDLIVYLFRDVCSDFGIDVSAAISDHNLYPETCTSEEYKEHVLKPGEWLNNHELEGYLLSMGYIQCGTKSRSNIGSLGGIVLEFKNASGEFVRLHNNAVGFDAGNMSQATGTHWQAVKPQLPALIPLGLLSQEYFDEVDIGNINKFWGKYTLDGIEAILKLRINNLYPVKKLEVFKGIFLSQDYTNIPEIINHILDKDLESSESTKENINVVLVNLWNKHAVGILFERDISDQIVINYIDSAQEKIPTELKNILIAEISKKYSDFKVVFEECSFEKQKYINCGPELIENIVLHLTGERISQEDAIKFHSGLIENELLLGSNNSDFSHYFMNSCLEDSNMENSSNEINFSDRPDYYSQGEQTIYIMGDVQV